MQHFSVIRTQLQVLRWFLEAMRSDNSTLMVPITSAWAYKLVKSYKAIFFIFVRNFSPFGWNVISCSLQEAKDW